MYIINGLGQLIYILHISIKNKLFYIIFIHININNKKITYLYIFILYINVD